VAVRRSSYSLAALSIVRHPGKLRTIRTSPKKAGGLEHKAVFQPAGSHVAEPPGSPGLPFELLSDTYHVILSEIIALYYRVIQLLLHHELL